MADNARTAEELTGLRAEADRSLSVVKRTLEDLRGLTGDQGTEVYRELRATAKDLLDAADARLRAKAEPEAADRSAQEKLREALAADSMSEISSTALQGLSSSVSEIDVFKENLDDIMKDLNKNPLYKRSTDFLPLFERYRKNIQELFGGDDHRHRRPDEPARPQRGDLGGEHGRGFSVVADEVSKLSERVTGLA